MPTLAVDLFYSPSALKQLEYGIRTNNFQIGGNHTDNATQIPEHPANRGSKSEGNRVRGERRSRTLHRRNRSCGAFLWGISKASSKTSSTSASASASAASSAAGRSSGERISGGGGELPCAMPDQTTPAAADRARGTFAGETTPRDRRARHTAQTSPRDRRERQVEARREPSRGSPRRREASSGPAHTHTHSQLPRGSAAPFLPHPDSL